MIKEEKILNGYIVASRVLDLDMYQIAAAETMDEISDSLRNIYIDIADLIRKAEHCGVYTDRLMESCNFMRAAIKYYKDARDSYRIALQEYLGEH